MAVVRVAEEWKRRVGLMHIDRAGPDYSIIYYFAPGTFSPPLQPTSSKLLFSKSLIDNGVS